MARRHLWLGGIDSDVGHLQRDVEQLQTDLSQLQKAINQIQADVAVIKDRQGIVSEHAGYDGDAQEEQRADTAGAAVPKQGSEERVKGGAP